MLNKLLLATGMTCVMSLFLSTGKQIAAYPLTYQLDLGKAPSKTVIQTMRKPSDRSFQQNLLPSTEASPF